MKVYFEQMYVHIGYLFYAVAAEHGALNAVTFDKLNHLVARQWSAVANGTTVESHLDSCLRSALRKVFDDAIPADEAFEHFKSYYGIHSLAFGKALRLKIYATANRIASEFSWNGKKSEFILSLEKMLTVNPIELT